jgi:hypothetical protein
MSIVCKRCRGNFVSDSNNRQGDEYCAHCFEVCRLLHNKAVRNSGQSYTREKEARSGKLLLLPVTESRLGAVMLEVMFKKPEGPHVPLYQCLKCGGSKDCFPCTCAHPVLLFGPGAPRLEPSLTWEDPQGSGVTWGPTRCPGCGALLAERGPPHCLVCQTPIPSPGRPSWPG